MVCQSLRWFLLCPLWLTACATLPHPLPIALDGQGAIYDSDGVGDGETAFFLLEDWF